MIFALVNPAVGIDVVTMRGKVLCYAIAARKCLCRGLPTFYRETKQAIKHKHNRLTRCCENAVENKTPLFSQFVHS